MLYSSEPHEARRVSEFDFAAPAIVGAEKYPMGKLDMRRIIESAGLRAPRLLATFDTPDKLELDYLPDRFALKLDNLASKRGVFLLQRLDAGAPVHRYRELFRHRDYDRDELVSAMREACERRRKSFAVPVFAEEMVIGENGDHQIPFDYKLYTFDGTVRFIVQIDRNTTPGSIAFFNGDFEPLERNCILSHNASVQLGPHMRPANWEELLATASRVSAAMDVPFVSVDVYTTGREVVVGELTHTPGGPFYGMWQFSDVFDAELGTYYRIGMLKRGMPIPVVTKLPPVLRKANEAAAKAARRRNAPPGVGASTRMLAGAVRRSIARHARWRR